MKTNKIKRIAKKLTASILVTSLLITSSGMQNLSVKAATTKKYISDIKLFTGKITDSLKKKYPGYIFLENSLSEGGGGTEIHMAYKTTTDPEDAIRDIALMQMGGNYSINAYENVLKENSQLAAQRVEESKAVVEEFRANYNSTNPDKKKLADQAYDLLNKYYEDDTKLGMGDFFLNSDGKVTEANFITLAMQSTSATQSLLYSILAKACDTDENATWLDRLVSYNGFDGLARANGFNPDDIIQRNIAADKFDEEYGNLIGYLTTNVEDSNGDEENAWNKFATGLSKYVKSLDEAIEDFNTTNDEMKDADIANVDDAVEVEKTTQESESVLIYSAIYETLSKIEYGDGTLADLFMKTSDKMTKEDFYPILAALSEGQKVVLLNVGFSALFSSAAEQTASNAVKDKDAILKADEEDVKNDAGKNMEDIQQETADSQIEATEEIIETVEEEMSDDVIDDMIVEVKEGSTVDEKISVYAGVDRSFFSDGIAMTTDAQNKDSEGGLHNKKTIHAIAYITGSLGVASIIGGATILAFTESIKLNALNSYKALVADITKIQESTQQMVVKMESAGIRYSNAWKYYTSQIDKYASELKTIDAKASQAQARIATGCKIVGTALLVVGLALTAYSIVDSILTFLKKDDPSYTEIPAKMVDSSNGEKTDMEDFLNYNVAKNDNDEGQDLNNWTSGNWLAMYTSKTKDAGDPILADSIKIQKDANGTNGMYAAHLFGQEQRTAYNLLTYSKNKDSQPKLFMYYDKVAPSENSGSIFGQNTVLVSIILIALAIVGTSFGIFTRKEKVVLKKHIN